jgi:hypothetical protein
MRKVLAIALLITLTVACHKTVTAPVPGQLNTFDAYAYRVLFDSQAAINSFKASPSAQVPAVKTVLNQAISDYNIAEGAYQAWHATGGSGDTTTISNAISRVQADIAGIAAQGGR